MPSTLTWLDHDSSARDRTLRILAMFEERDTRNELGLGAIRDSFSDLLFPGTSTVHTRLRYFLIIPWVYRIIERDGTPTHRIPGEARELELDVTESLKESGESHGVFGISVGRRLKTLPSTIYWAGLRAWGIRRFDGTQAGYHASIDLLRSRRAAVRRKRRAGESDGFDDPTVTWDPGLPEAPDTFPALPSLDLEPDEAEFLQDRVAQQCRGTLLAHMFLNPMELTGSGPWEHPAAEAFPEGIRRILDHARKFSETMHGASLLYNLLLSRASRRADRIEEYEKLLGRWKESTDLGPLHDWSLDELWTTVGGSGHRISPGARRFVEAWLARVLEASGDLIHDQDALRLIENRERRVKGARARLNNPRLLEQWGGASSPEAFDYRWRQVKVFGNDLLRGLVA